MAAPSTPTLSLTRTSSTSFSAAVGGDSGGTIHRLFYRKIWEGNPTTGNTVTNPGTITQIGLDANTSYLVWIVSDNGEYSLPVHGVVSLCLADSIAMAIKSKWDSLPTLVSAAGRLYTQEVPEREGDDRVTLPYSWINVGKSFFDWTFETLYFESTEVELCIMKHGLNSAENAAEIFRQNFDWDSLTFTDPTQNRSLIVTPTNYSLDKDFLPWKDGSPVYTAHLSYQIVVERHLSQ